MIETAGADDRPTTYAPDKLYAVQFARVVQMGAFKYVPRHPVLMKGGALNRIVAEYGPDVIASAEQR